MTPAQIDARIRALESLLSRERDLSTVRTITHLLERLIMMDPQLSERGTTDHE